MNIRAKIYGSSVPAEPIFRDKRPKGAHSDDLSSISVLRQESRRGNSRGKDRHRLSSEEAVLRHGGQEHVVELVNLSSGGAMIRGIPELALWDHVFLVFAEEGELECAVRWIKGDQAGLEFAHETRIDCDQESHDELLRAVIRKSFPDAATDPLQREAKRNAQEEEQEPSEARASRRHPLVWNGVVYHDYEVEPVRLRNISTTGALVQSSHPLAEGSTVFLEMNGAGRHEAVVRWTRAGQSGLAFTHGFDISLLANVRPEIANLSCSDDKKLEPWAPAWRRSTLDEIAKTLGG